MQKKNKSGNKNITGQPTIGRNSHHRPSPRDLLIDPARHLTDEQRPHRLQRQHRYLARNDTGDNSDSSSSCSSTMAIHTLNHTYNHRPALGTAPASPSDDGSNGGGLNGGRDGSGGSGNTANTAANSASPNSPLGAGMNVPYGGAPPLIMNETTPLFVYKTKSGKQYYLYDRQYNYNQNQSQPRQAACRLKRKIQQHLPPCGYLIGVCFMLLILILGAIAPLLPHSMIPFLSRHPFSSLSSNTGSSSSSSSSNHFSSSSSSSSSTSIRTGDSSSYQQQQSQHTSFGSGGSGSGGSGGFNLQSFAAGSDEAMYFERLYEHVPKCGKYRQPCFQQHHIQVPTDRIGYRSYWDYAGPMNVTYDKRSFLINEERTLFLSGSMHPTRATLQTWNQALDEAVRNGLNMITIYIMWSAHQKGPEERFDWRLPNHLGCNDEEYFQNYFSEHGEEVCEWTVAHAIRAAASRGLFVHLRIGPYVCAEYSYGGIPEWLPLKYPNMDMRRPNRYWLEAMQKFVHTTVEYITANQLWAYQGGPIVMGQIENELGGDMDGDIENLVQVDSTGQLIFDQPKNQGEDVDMVEVKNATMQDYANWCGKLVDQVAPNVVWTMCYGLSAPNTISTFNGFDGTPWLESHGSTGRIQNDQPAMWTEDEGGFQIWGDAPTHPSDYVWGQTARSMAYKALRWFARGGTHLNYYMWWGGYNMGRTAAAGIMNMYASEACMCPSGERRQPKFAHLEALHGAIADVASILLHTKTSLLKNQTVDFMNDQGVWQTGSNPVLFRYTLGQKQRSNREAIFIENNINESRVVRVFLKDGTYQRIFEMAPYSAVLFLDGAMIFDSVALHPPSLALTRKISYDPVTLLDWASWNEPVGASWESSDTVVDTFPIEQTVLNVNASLSSDYAWYSTDVTIPHDLDEVTLHISTSQANAMIVYIDGAYFGSNDTHHHKEGDALLNITLRSPLCRGPHQLAILSESLGYGNLIGRWGGGTRAKTKGITGDVWLSSPQLDYNISLVDGRLWGSAGGLHGERLPSSPKKDSIRRKDLEDGLWWNTLSYGGLWSSARFDTPRYDSATQALFFDVQKGRGRMWLNGVDIGKFWNITRGGTNEHSQQFYFIPSDLLYMNGQLNEIVVFDAYVGSYRGPKLALSWVEPSDSHWFKDEVGFVPSCL